MPSTQETLVIEVLISCQKPTFQKASDTHAHAHAHTHSPNVKHAVYSIFLFKLK